jgi:ABC-type phosphate transport system substrate-binding protein
VKTLFKYSAFIYCLLFFSNSYAQVVLIAQPQSVVTELSRNSLRAIFAMRQTEWEDGSAIQVFVLEDKKNAHIVFCKDVLGMFPYQLRRVWDRQVFSGTGTAPILVGSEQEMLQRVAETKGAIGYLMVDNKTKDSISSKVKIIGEKS